jgi:hypothetical protein
MSDQIVFIYIKFMALSRQWEEARKFQVICSGEEGQKAINNNENENQQDTSEFSMHAHRISIRYMEQVFLLLFQMGKVRHKIGLYDLTKFSL